jgi:hypothetical protein
LGRNKFLPNDQQGGHEMNYPAYTDPEVGDEVYLIDNINEMYKPLKVLKVLTPNSVLIGSQTTHGTAVFNIDRLCLVGKFVNVPKDTFFN